MSCHWSLSIFSENVKKFDVYRGYRKRSVVQGELKTANYFWEKLYRVLNAPVFKAATQLKDNSGMEFSQEISQYRHSVYQLRIADSIRNRN